MLKSFFVTLMALTILGCSRPPEPVAQKPDIHNGAVAPSSQGQKPLAFDVGVSQGDTRSIEVAAYIILKDELQEATQGFYAVTGRTPTSISELTDAGLLFHAPLGSDGKTMALVDEVAGIPPAVNTVSYDWSDPDKVVFRINRANPVLPPSTNFDLDLKAHVVGAVDAGFSKKLIAPTSDFTGWRSLVGRHDVRWVLQLFRSGSGHWAKSWDEALTAFQLGPVGYTPYTSTAPEAGSAGTIAFTIDDAHDLLRLRINMPPHPEETEDVLYTSKGRQNTMANVERGNRLREDQLHFRPFFIAVLAPAKTVAVSGTIVAPPATDTSSPN